MSSSTEASRSINYISSDSDETESSTAFKIRLFHDYKKTAWLPNTAALNPAARWVFITVPHGRTYKIQIIENGQTFLLQRGWSILAAIENLQEGDKLAFQVQTNNNLHMTIHSPPDHAPPVGFSPVRNPPLLQNVPDQDIVLNEGTTITATVRRTIRKVWNATSINSRIYVCRLLISPSEGNFLIFNKTYTRLIPKEHANVAMRFLGSNIILPGAIKTYTDGNARMIKEWPMYARDHNLTFGETFVCKIH